MTEHIETEVVICEECEDVDSSVFCTNCGQRLCSQCDMRIHNKGNRLLHKRLPIVIANPMSTEQQSKQQNEQSQQQQLNGQCIDNIMENISNNNNNGQSQSQQQQQQQQDDSGVVATPKESVNAISLNETSSQQAETPRMKGWSPTQANSQSNNQGADEYDKNMPILSNNNNNNDGISNSNQFSQQSTEGLLTHGDNQTAFKQQQQQLLMLMMQYQQQQLLTNQQQQHQQQQDKVFTQQGHSQQQYQQPQSFSLSNSNQQQSLSLPNLQSGQQQQQSQQYQSPFSLPSQQQQQMLLLQLHQQLQYQALQQQQQQQSHNHPQQQPPHQIPQFFSNSPQANRMFDTQHSTQANLLQANLSTSVDSSYESTHIPPAHEFLFGSSFFAPNLLSQQQQQQQSQQILVEPSPTASRQNKTFNVSMDHFSFGEEQDNNNASFLSNKTLASNIPVNPIEIPLRQDLSHFDSKDVHMEITKKLLLERAKQGDLLIKIDSFKESFEKEIGKGQFVNTEKIIRSLESKEIIHCTTRKFGDSEPISYLSLKLSGISIECLVWIIESIRRDEMTPTDKMVLSRLKECYAVKINQLYWNGVLLYIKSLADINGDVILNTPLLPNLKLKRVQDAVTLVDSFLIYTKVNNSAWVHADNGPVQESDRDLWRIFIEFLKEFFYENTENGNGNNGGINDNNNNNNDGSNNNNFQNALKQQQQVQPSQKHKWTSSVENVHTKTTKKTLVRPPKSISKAIPGGRYGCAQLLKCCGPLPLRSCSLGKLSLFVQEAISKGILVYYKTLLIKPTNFDFDEVMDISVLDSQLSQQQQQQQSQQHQQQKSSSSSSQGCVGMQQQRCESESGNVTDIVTDIIQISNNNSDQQMNQSAQNNSASFNHHMQTSVSEEKLSKEQVEKIAVVKLTILEILSENASGVSLARLPKLIQKKIEFAFDLHELGFPKLKSLLQTVHGVAIEKDGTTQAQAVLKNENSNGEESVEDREIFNEQSIGTSKDFSNLESQQHQYQFIHLYPQQQQSSSAQSQYHKAFKVPAAKEKINQNNNIKPTGRFFAKSDDTGAQQLQQQHYNDTQNLNGSSQNSNNNNNSGSNNSNNSSNNNNNNSNNLNNNNQRDLSPQSYNRKFCTLKPERPQAKKIQPIAQNGRTFSNLEDYRSKVIETIQSILKDNPSGLISHKLNELLNQKLNAQFQLSLFGCVNFNEFLVKFTESFADILVKQSNYIIYAKNSHMNPLTLRQILNQNNNINANNNNNNTNNSHSLNQFNNQQGQGSQQQQYQQQFQQPQQSQTSQFQQNHSPLAQNNTNNLRMSSSCNSSFLSSPPQWKNNNNESFIVQNNSQISQSFSACSVNVTGGNNNQPSEINNQLQNESHTDIEVNLKFIEELLNDEDKGNLNSGHHRRYSSNSTGTFHAFKGCYDNNIFYNQLKSPNNYHTQRKYSPLYSNDFPEIIHEEPNHLNYNNNNNNVIVNHNNNVNTNNNNLGNKYCPPQPSQFGHMPPASKSMNLELQGLTLAYQAALQGDKGKQKLRHKTLNYQK